MSGAGGWIRPPWGQSRWPIETEETGSFFIGSLRKQTFKKILKIQTNVYNDSRIFNRGEEEKE